MTSKDGFKNWPEAGWHLGAGLTLLPSNFSLYPEEPEKYREKFSFYKAFSVDMEVFWVEPNTLVGDAVKDLGLLRMDDLSQLQSLTTGEVGGDRVEFLQPHVFSHTRLTHNLRAGALHGLIAKNLRLDEKDTEIGILADCMHDTFTPAGGDSWKDVNHQRSLFDEDYRFAERIFNYYPSAWRNLCHRYQLGDPENTALKVQDIVQGKGLHGQIHEVADTASYMLGDLAEIKKFYHYLGDKNMQRVISFSEQHEWDLWNFLKVEENQLVATNRFVLENFLRLRVMLWKNLYQNPGTKFLELVAREIVYPYLVGYKKIIKPFELISKSDSWLSGLIRNEMRLRPGALKRLDFLGNFPQRVTCLTWGQALDFEDQKHAEGAFTLVFSIKDFQQTKSKTNKYLINDLEGKVVTFKEAFPTMAGRIEEMAAEANSNVEPINVCWVERAIMYPNFRQAWKQARARWKQRR